MSTATAAQIRYISDLRADLTHAADEERRDAQQYSVEVIADAVRRLAIRDYRSAHGVRGAAAREACPMDDAMVARAERLRDAEWAERVADHTVDPTTLTKAEASALIDRLKTGGGAVTFGLIHPRVKPYIAVDDLADRLIALGA